MSQILTEWVAREDVNATSSTIGVWAKKSSEVVVVELERHLMYDGVIAKLELHSAPENDDNTKNIRVKCWARNLGWQSSDNSCHILHSW